MLAIFALFLGVVIIITSGRLTPYDNALLYWVNGWTSREMTFAMKNVSLLGSELVWFAISGLLWLMGDERKRKTGILLGATIVLAEVAEFFVKNSIQRPRPLTVLPGIIAYGVVGGFSFPSGHVVRAFAGAYVISHFHRPFMAPILVWAGAMGLSRMYLGVHYPTDVLGGALFGTLLAMTLVSQIPRFASTLEKLAAVPLLLRRIR